jgi:hypothetical protein
LYHAGQFGDSSRRFTVGELAAEFVEQLRRHDAHPVVTHPRDLRMTVELNRESVRVDALDRLGHAKHHCRDGRSARRLSGSGFEISPERDDARNWARPGPPGMAGALAGHDLDRTPPRPPRSRNLSELEGVKGA